MFPVVSNPSRTGLATKAGVDTLLIVAKCSFKVKVVASVFSSEV
jgi:hypothetical protein